MKWKPSGAFKFFLQFGFSLLALYIIARNLDLSVLKSQAGEVNPLRLAIAFSFHFVALFVSLIRWQLLLRPLGIRLSWFAVGWVYMMGGFFNSFLPTSIGGDAVRILKTGEWSGHPAEATVSVVVERWTGLIAFLLFCLLALVLGAHKVLGLTWSLMILVLTLGMVLVLAFVMRRVDPDADGNRNVGLIVEKWLKFRHAMVRYRDSPGAFTWAMIWGLVVQGVLILYYGVLAWSLNLPVHWMGLAVAVPLSELVSMIPVSLGGFGTREAVFFGLAGLLRMPPELAVWLALVRGLLGVLFNMLGIVTLWVPYHPHPVHPSSSSSRHTSGG